MTPDFWHARWQRGETGWHQHEINCHLQAFWPDLGLPAGTPVFVPLCGKTLDLLWLVGRGHSVLGVEISEIAVQQFFDQHRLTPRVTDAGAFRRWQVDELTLLCGDFFELGRSDLAGVGAVYDRASLIALPPQMRPGYAAHLKAVIPATAPCLLITLAYDQREMTGPPFAVHRAEVEALYADHYRVHGLAAFDAIDDSPNFRRRGLTALSEEVWRLDPRGT